MDKFYSIVVNDAATGLEEEHTDFLNEEDARKSFDEFKDSGDYSYAVLREVTTNWRDYEEVIELDEWTA